MYKILAFVLFLLSCQENPQIKKTSIQNNNGSYHFVSFPCDSTEEYFEYLGELDILTTRYKALNFFKRIKAAELWHGQSRLVFFNNKDTIAYMLDANSDFPIAIENNQLYFPQKRMYYHPDSLSNILCLPTGCIEKDIPFKGLKYYLSFDSIRQVFRGGFAPQ